MSLLAIFDFDFTLSYVDDNFHSNPELHVREYHLYPDVDVILYVLKSLNIRLAVASNNINCPELLKELGINKYFDLVLAYNDSTEKVSHVKTIMEHFPEIKPEDITFFDDSKGNIEACKTLGIKCCLIDVNFGITWKNTVRTITNFK